MARLSNAVGDSARLLKFIQFNEGHKNNETAGSKKEPKVKVKVKTGCITCRIRKVKCDEGKPACHRCTSTGRKCDGYAPPPPKKDTSKPSNDLLQRSCSGSPFTGFLLDIPGTNDELRFMEFFHFRTAPTLSGYFDEYFWRRLILQVSHVEPTVRHAMTAVSSVHEQFETIGPLALYPDGDDIPAVGSHALALHQYNRAINSLNQHLSQGDPSLRVTLICCILFICLEFLRGNQQIAMTHFFNGLNILRKFRDNSENSLAGSPGGESHLNNQFVEDYIVPIFSRLSILSLLFDRPYDPQPLPIRRQISESTIGVNQFFSTLSEARNALIDTLNPTIRFVTTPHIYKETYREGKIGPADVEEKNSLEFTLQKWLDAFEAFLERSAASLTDQDRQGATVLRIQHRVVFIWLSTRGSLSQSSYDDYTADFEFITTHAETLTGVPCCDIYRAPKAYGGTEHIPPSFVFDLGVIPVLYFTAIKCRHPLIRRKALALLSTTPRREGLWDAAPVARVAERVMRIEEDPLDPSQTDEFPPEWTRVHDVDFQTDFAKPGFQRVLLTRALPGPGRELEAWEEFI